MSKLRAAWEWLLFANTRLLMMFHLFVWMPAVMIVWVNAGLDHPSSSFTTTALKNVSLTYLMFALLTGVCFGV